MKVALIGATGFIGSKILTEAVDRNHHVTAIARHTEKIPVHPNITRKQGDVLIESEVTKLVAGHDAVIVSYNPGWMNPNLVAEQHAAAKSITEGVRKSGVKRLLVVGGAGSLQLADGTDMLDAAFFPQEYKAAAAALRDYLLQLRKETELDWTFFSPAAIIEPGERTGKFRLGGDQVVFNEKNESKISVDDYAIAMIDELENPKHIKARFTIAY